MSEKPTYYDIRAGLWEKSWDLAKSYNEFLIGASSDHIARWNETFERTPDLMQDQVEKLIGYDRTIKVLMVAGVWCMDCSRTAPYLKKIINAIGNKAELRIIDRDTIQMLKDEIHVMGAPRVPCVIFLSEDWFELGRFSDRTLSVYRSKMAREVGRGIVQGILSPQSRERELSEWVEIVERILIMLRLAPMLRKRYGD